MEILKINSSQYIAINFLTATSIFPGVRVFSEVITPTLRYTMECESLEEIEVAQRLDRTFLIKIYS